MTDELRLGKRSQGPSYRKTDELVVWANDDGTLHTTDEDGTDTALGAGGGGGSQPPVTFTGTDPDEAVLTLRADDAQTELVFRVYDEAGDLAVDIDRDGVLDARKITVQDPPDTGTGSPTVTATITPGTVRLIPEPSTTPLEIWGGGASGDGAQVVVRARGFGSVLELAPRDNDDVPLQIILPNAPSVNVVELWDNSFENLLFAVTPTGGIRATLPTSNPGAGLLWNDAGTVKVGT